MPTSNDCSKPRFRISGSGEGAVGQAAVKLTCNVMIWRVYYSNNKHFFKKILKKQIGKMFQEVRKGKTLKKGY